jgi:hypothetical protein
LSGRFLGYEFSTYGWDVLTLNNMNPEDRADPMNVVFPKVNFPLFKSRYPYLSPGSSSLR